MGGEKGEQTQNHRSKQLEAETELYVFHIHANSGPRLQVALVLVLLIVPSLTSTAAGATACHRTELSYFPAPGLSTGIFTKRQYVFYVLQRRSLKCYSNSCNRRVLIS